MGTYKLNSLTIHNIGIIEDMEIPINRPMLAFMGDCMQGKTTVLSAVRLLFGGAFSADILRHGTDEGHVQLAWAGGSLRREFYVGKDMVTRARPIAYVLDGVPQKNPVEKIKALLNPFLLDQDYLIRMPEAQRAAYLLGVLAVDTTDLDAELATCTEQAKQVRTEIRLAGEIDVTPVEPPGDERALRAERAKMRQVWEDAKRSVEAGNKVGRDAAAQRDALGELLGHLATRKAELAEELERIRGLLIMCQEDMADTRVRLDRLPEPANETPMPPEPDLSTYDEQLADLKAQAVRYEAYQDRLQRAGELAAKKQGLAAIEQRERELRAARVARLVEANGRCPVAGLEFDADGSLRYEGTTAGMLSHSQLMRLSSAISGLYPHGLGIELLDRGESLGKGIWAVAERAKANDLTILATIVAERPATVPEDVGVFVVEGGRVVCEGPQPEPEAAWDHEGPEAAVWVYVN